MPDPGPICFATARLHSWEIAVHCPTCRILRPLDLLAMGLGKHDETPIATLAKRRVFRCRKCGGREATIRVSRVRVGVLELVAEFRQG